VLTKRKRHSDFFGEIGVLTLGLGFAIVLAACSARPGIKAPIPQIDFPGETEPKVLSLAVLPFQDNGFAHSSATLGLGQTLAGRIVDHLATQPGITVVDRDEIEKVLGELALSSRGLTEAEGRLQMGRLLGAQYLIVGGYMVIGGQLRIDGRMIEVERGLVASTSSLEGSISERAAMEAAFTKKMSEMLLAKARRVPMQAPVTSQDHLRRGRFYEQSNEDDKALQHYQKALSIDSNNQEARIRMESLLLKELE